MGDGDLLPEALTPQPSPLLPHSDSFAKPLISYLCLSDSSTQLFSHPLASGGSLLVHLSVCPVYRDPSRYISFSLYSPVSHKFLSSFLNHWAELEVEILMRRGQRWETCPFFALVLVLPHP